MTEEQIRSQVTKFHVRFRHVICNEQKWPIEFFELACPASSIDMIVKMIMSLPLPLEISKDAVEIVSRIYYAGMIDGVKHFNRALKNGEIDF